MATTINMLEDGDDIQPGSGLSSVFVNEDETMIVFFTAEAETHHVHYQKGIGCLLCGKESAVGSCIACDIGMKAEETVFLPVYCPESGEVQVLVMPKRTTGGALYPQIRRVMKEGKDERVMAFVRKEGYAKYAVDGQVLPEGIDDGASAVADFLDNREQGKVKLIDAIVPYDRDRLLDCEGIERKARARKLIP